jgi:hypothetical protein
VLIGENGSGKPTVLRAMVSCPMCPVAAADDDAVKHITTETLNPNVGGIFSSRSQMLQGIRALFFSHGQGVVAGVVGSLRNRFFSNETVVEIDSPETGQEIRCSIEIHRGLIKRAKHCQVISATNSSAFMGKGHLIDLGRKPLPRLLTTIRKLAADFDSHSWNGSRNTARNIGGKRL